MTTPIDFTVTASGALKWGDDLGLSSGYTAKKEVGDSLPTAQTVAAIYYVNGTSAVDLMKTDDTAWVQHTIGGVAYVTFETFQDKLLELGFKP